MCVKSKWMMANTTALTNPAIKKFVFCTRDPKITRRKINSSNIGANIAIERMATGAAAEIFTKTAVFSDPGSTPRAPSMTAARDWPINTMKKPRNPHPIDAPIELFLPFKLVKNDLSF